eukprot:3644229-Rhodomonas_salina.1
MSPLQALTCKKRPQSTSPVVWRGAGIASVAYSPHPQQLHRKRLRKAMTGTTPLKSLQWLLPLHNKLMYPHLAIRQQQ